MKNKVKNPNKMSLKERYGKPFKFLWAYIKMYKVHIIFVVVASFIISMITAGITIGEFYFLEHITNSLPPLPPLPGQGDNKTDEQNIISIIYLCSLLVGVVIALVLYVFQTVFMTKIAQYSSKALRKDLYFKILELKLQYFDTTPSGDIMSRLTNDINNITMALTQNVTQFLICSTQILFFLLTLLLFSPILGAFAILFIPVQLSVVYILFKKAQPNYLKKQVALGDLNGFAEETISGQKVINNFNKQHLVVNQFIVKNQNIKNISYKSDLLSSLTNPWNTLMGNVLIALMFVIGMFLSIGNVNFGGIVSTVDSTSKTNAMLVLSLLTAVMTFTRNFTNPIYQIFQLLTLLQGAIAGTNRTMVINEQKNEVLPKEEVIDVKGLKGHVKFDNLSFSYDGKKDVLKNINLDIKPGQVVGIVGPTGSGKTTIINLLTKFYDVTNKNSDILIDDYSIKKITKNSLREEVSIVLQDTFIFGASIYENIRYSNPKATNEEIEDACKKADAHSFIMALENGYETVLENNADDISQGQRQLLAIARAFLKKSSILILDEATSSVDTKTEKDIQRAMIALSKGKTTFMIAHRLSTIKHADVIVVLKDGEILEKGNHSQLLKKGGFYANMYNSRLNTPEDI
ncbi:MAG: ABC transporter ATP-binding protein [Mycoplasma sp.]|nr:ABC transporter ATP-binding protein [Mycoplasma sp.]